MHLNILYEKKLATSFACRGTSLHKFVLYDVLRIGLVAVEDHKYLGVENVIHARVIALAERLVGVKGWGTPEPAAPPCASSNENFCKKHVSRACAVFSRFWDGVRVWGSGWEADPRGEVGVRAWVRVGVSDMGENGWGGDGGLAGEKQQAVGVGRRHRSQGKTRRGSGDRSSEA